MRGLLFITHQTERYAYLESVELALRGGCRQIQLRMKDVVKEVVERTAFEAKAMCDSFEAALYIDDYVDICQEVGARGVHLGKLDMPPGRARALLGHSVIIGGTANSFADIVSLHAQGVNYIGLGPFRFTETKKNLAPTLGLDGYARIIEQCQKEGIPLPICAIGGVTCSDIPSLLEAGVSSIAMSSSILMADNPIEEIKNIIHTIKQNES